MRAAALNSLLSAKPELAEASSGGVRSLFDDDDDDSEGGLGQQTGGGGSRAASKGLGTPQVDSLDKGWFDDATPTQAGETSSRNANRNADRGVSSRADTRVAASAVNTDDLFRTSDEAESSSEAEDRDERPPQAAPEQLHAEDDDDNGGGAAGATAHASIAEGATRPEAPPPQSGAAPDEGLIAGDEGDGP